MRRWRVYDDVLLFSLSHPLSLVGMIRKGNYLSIYLFIYLTHHSICSPIYLLSNYCCSNWIEDVGKESRAEREEEIERREGSDVGGREGKERGVPCTDMYVHRRCL